MVHIIDDWYFIPDGTQYMLMRKYKESKKSRKGQGQTFGYFTSLDHLLKRLTDILVANEVEEGKIETISEYIVAYRTAARELKGVIG